MKRSLKNLSMIVMILATLIGGSFQSSPAEALGQPQEETLSLPSTWYNGQLRDVSGFGTPASSIVYGVGYGRETSTSNPRPLIYEKTNWASPITPGLPGDLDWGTLEGVWGADADTAYAVGKGTDVATGTSFPLIYKRSGGWTSSFLDFTLAGWTSPDLEDVWGTSATNVFAVGNGTNAGKTKALIARTTNGTTWNPIGVPDLTSLTKSELFGVWGTSDGVKIFAVGRGPRPTTGLMMPLIYYSMNSGANWTALTLSSTNWESGQLYAVWGSGPNDIYAVGSGSRPGSAEQTPLIYHSINGTIWEDISSQLLFNEESGELFGIWGSSATDVYLAGSIIDGTKPLLYRRRTTGSWAASSPLTTTVWGNGYFSGIWGSGPDDVYLAGDGFKVSAPTIRMPLLSHALEDMFPPGPVTDLAAESGEISGSANLTWRDPVDDAGNANSGSVDTYIVRYSDVDNLSTCDAGGSLVTSKMLPTPVKPGNLQTMTIRGLVLGKQYFFLVCAVDDDGWKSTPSETSSFIYPGGGIYDDTDPNWTYTGNWSLTTTTGPYNGTDHYSNDPSAMAAFTFRGTGFSLKYVKYSNRGNIQVWIDGVRQLPDINANSSGITWQATYTKNGLENRVHMVEFRYGGPAGSFIDIDAIQIYSPAIGGIYDDTDPNWTYTGNWTPVKTTGPYNGTDRYTNDASATASFMFYGVGFSLKYVKYSNRGNIQVWIDGVRQLPDINANSSGITWQATYTKSGLVNKVHTVVFKHGGPAGSFIDIDAIQIYSPAIGGIYDDTASNWTYTGNWTPVKTTGPYNDTDRYTNDASATASFMFIGTGFNFKYVKYSNRGNIQVWIDGVRQLPDINANSSGITWQATYTKSGLENEIHTVVFKHGGPAGFFIDIDSIQISEPDTLAPGNVTGLSASPGSNGSIDLSWIAPPDDAGNNGSGPVTSYLVKYSTTPFASWDDGTLVPVGSPTPTAPGSTQTMTVVGLTPETTYYFAVRAQDEESNPSADYATASNTTGPFTPPGADTYDDTDPNWVWSGNWTSVTTTGPYNGTDRYSNDPNAMAAFTFEGYAFTLSYLKYSNRGNIQVWIDGVRQLPDISANSPTLTWQATYRAPNLENKVHTVVFKHGGPAGSFIDIDAIQIYSPAIPDTYDDTDPHWMYTGSWTPVTTTGPYNDTDKYTNDTSATASFMFSGTGFNFKYVKYSNRGNIQVWIDGVQQLPDINANSSTLDWQATYTKSGLVNKVHSVVFKHGGPAGSFIDIDSIEILP